MAVATTSSWAKECMTAAVDGVVTVVDASWPLGLGKVAGTHLYKINQESTWDSSFKVQKSTQVDVDEMCDEDETCDPVPSRGVDTTLERFRMRQATSRPHGGVRMQTRAL
jgi:hypothetical protein